MNVEFHSVILHFYQYPFNGYTFIICVCNYLLNFYGILACKEHCQQYRMLLKCLLFPTAVSYITYINAFMYNCFNYSMFRALVQSQSHTVNEFYTACSIRNPGECVVRNYMFL